ncbi:MAG: sugar-binding transcriptional regulator [Anaerolineales bacterium]|nr:sugar-binding transcriptional regulator [Anaerolineales bacterium]
MGKKQSRAERDELLADIAEMYYERAMTQAEISREVGITRSAISRLLTEARQRGIVEIHIQRPIRFNSELAQKLKTRFSLKVAHVLTWEDEGRYEILKQRLGAAGAKVFSDLEKDGQVIGVAWGYTVSAVIDAMPENHLAGVKVTQLVGVLGSSVHKYSGQALVEKLAGKLDGEGVYLYTPFIVEKPQTATVLRNDQSVRETMLIGQNCDLAILGIGSTIPEYCSLFQGGHIQKSDLKELQQAGAVGDVCGHYFTADGSIAQVAFHQRLIGISLEDLRNTPVRLAVAGGLNKAEAILGAIRGELVNHLIVDSLTAARILALDAP